MLLGIQNYTGCDCILLSVNTGGFQFLCTVIQLSVMGLVPVRKGYLKSTECSYSTVGREQFLPRIQSCGSAGGQTYVDCKVGKRPASLGLVLECRARSRPWAMLSVPPPKKLSIEIEKLQSNLQVCRSGKPGWTNTSLKMNSMPVFVFISNEKLRFIPLCLVPHPVMLKSCFLPVVWRGLL